jgi:hypothetical protein
MTKPETRAAYWLEAWDRQGTHRTGTPGDRAGAKWLAEQAAALGGEVSVEEFAFERLDPALAYLDIGDERVTGVPCSMRQTARSTGSRAGWAQRLPSMS